MWNHKRPHLMTVHLEETFFFSFYLFILFLKRFYLLAEEKGGRKRRRETSMCVASCTPPTGDLAWNPGMCPNRESNQRPLIHRLVLNPLSHTSQGLFIYFLERGKGRAKKRERDIDVQEIHQSVAPHIQPSRDLACNPGMCPDQESNQRPFGAQASFQSTELHQPGLKGRFLNIALLFFWRLAPLNGSLSPLFPSSPAQIKPDPGNQEKEKLEGTWGEGSGDNKERALLATVYRTVLSGP